METLYFIIREFKSIPFYIKSSVRELFCRHPEEDLEFIGNIHGDLIIHSNYQRSAWYCKKCKNIFFKPYLHKYEGPPKPTYNDWLCWLNEKENEDFLEWKGKITNGKIVRFFRKETREDR